MTTNQGYGFQNILHSAEGLIGSGQTTHPTQSTGTQGFINTAESLFGSGTSKTGQSTQLGTRFSGINNTIDTAQAMMGHTGTGGAGIEGFIDKGQALTGHQGPVGGIQGALNTAQGAMGMQKIMGSAQGMGGLQGAMNTAEGLIGQGHTGQTAETGQTVNRFGEINSDIDKAQAFMGHTGQGGAGFQGAIDKAQSWTGYTGQTGAASKQGTGGIQSYVNTAQGFLGSGHTGQSAKTGQIMNRFGEINSDIDKAQAFMGHTTQGGQGFQGAIDKAQSWTGYTGQTGNLAQKGTGGVQSYVNPAQGLIGSGHTGQTAHTGQTVNRAGGINSTIDRAQGYLGHTTQGGSGIQGTIDRAQGFIGHTGTVSHQGTSAQRAVNTTRTGHPPVNRSSGPSYIDRAASFLGQFDQAGLH